MKNYMPVKTEILQNTLDVQISVKERVAEQT